MKFEDLLKVYGNYDKTYFQEIKKYNESQKNDDDKLVCPLMLDDLPEYKNAKIKAMIFGQETNGWADPEDGLSFYEDSEKGIDSFLDLYAGYMKVFHEYNFRNGTPFNSEYVRIEKELAEISGNQSGVLWNNLIKLTLNKTNSVNKMHSGLALYNKVPAIKAASKLIKSELEYFKPNIILFYSGPDYDVVLKDKEIFPTASFEAINGFSERELCKVNIDGVDLALRTYHPGYLVRNQDFKNRVLSKSDELIKSTVLELNKK